MEHHKLKPIGLQVKRLKVNNFYFADDQIKNVKAVKEILDQVDVKSKVQQAKASKAETLNKEFNIIIEKKTGLGRDKQYSPARAKTVGANKGKMGTFGYLTLLRILLV